RDMGGPGFLCLTTYVATLYLTNISDKLHKDRALERELLQKTTMPIANASSAY
ncbi:hypothetical protein EC912_103506, partial [Luteibacter rhizovicinus]